MLVCGCANLLNSLGCQAELVLGLLQRFGVKGLLQVRVIVYFIVSVFYHLSIAFLL